MTHLSRSLVLGCSILALSACGPEEIASPGTGGNVTINNPAAPAPTPTPTSTGGTLVTPATGCPTIADPQGLTDEDTITGPEGEWRVCALPDVINVSSTLPRVPGLLYRLPGRVDVGTDGGAVPTSADTDVELTIEPGVIIYASGAAFLNVTRGNSINANGTEDMPIIMTSRDNVLGLNNANSSGQWGGLVLSGRAPVTDCFLPAAAPGTNDCYRRVEGATPDTYFGGELEDDSSGSVSYMQIRYSGFVLSGDDELQSLTTGGIGSGTDISFIQSVNSSDDGIEFFGGVVNAKNIIVAGAEDDSLDSDTGVKLNMQYVLVAQRQDIGDAIIEADSNNGLYDDLPRQDTQLVNATLIQRKVDDQVVRIRGAADYGIYNSVIIDQGSAATPCIRIDQAETAEPADAPTDENGPPVFNSVALDCATNFRDGSDGGPTAAEAEALFDLGVGNDKAFTSTIASGYLNGPNEDDFIPLFDVTTLPGGFFEASTFIGAVTASDDWTQGWTCDSAAITFTNNTGSCGAIPVFN
ncbi:hypothetical protein [Alteraurantiacibacter aquimixticola]|uniref:Serine/threonine protein kinase n=1 Tax=Alteraurantiacibacter aquimixticola TaxID=2489173 RepID=A0A4T3F119_9SPHN|nr:hypothetical protein [Alteraurantiacibacter aquimixticola]TIX49617.1 hypothetical protein E5222_12355 [Alteraurantiacibacter aquimixticola]